MKLKITLLCCLGFAAVLNAQLSQTGDIAFVGWNADGDDDVAFVTFKDIEPGTTIYFCDSEWNGSGFGTDEGDFTWTSPATTIAAGTVISINSLSASISPSLGTITLNNAGGLSSTSDALFAFLGTAPRTATTLLAAISNSASGFGTLDGSGLSLGTTAILLTEGVDIANYKGPRTGLDISGYLAQLGSATQWDEEDTAADDQANGTVPDLPFDGTMFTVANTDGTAPSVASAQVSSQTAVTVVFSEEVTEAEAEDVANYAFSPALPVTSIVYDNTLHSVVITHGAFVQGTAYTLTISGISDIAQNEMAEFTSADLFYNTLSARLVFSEIMYNAPSDNSNQLEFLEIYNSSAAAIDLGGIKVKDETNFVFTFPQMQVASHAVVLLATDKASAEAFYGQTFLDLPQPISNALGNGGELLQILNSTDTVISSVAYDDAAPWSTAPDGNGPSLELLNPAGDLNDGNNWAPATNLIGQSLGLNVYASPGTFTPVASSAISFDSEYVFVDENAGTAAVNISISNASPSEVTADVSVLSGIGTAIAGTDFTFAPQTITFPANSVTPVTLSVALTDNTVAGNDTFFVLKLDNATGAGLGGITTKTVYILDNEDATPVASGALDISYLSSYLVDPAGSSEIVAHDPVSQRLFVVNSTATKLAILDFSNPEAITQVAMIDMTAYGIGATSVSFRNGLVAATVQGADYGNGKVVFMDENGENIHVVEAGVLPDMVTFSPDGTKVLTANEGEPKPDYSIDPEGSVSVIEVGGGLSSITQANVTNINFNAFDSQIETLKASGVRIFGQGSSVSQDLEPEYVTVAADGQTAWVTLQENNAIAVINLATNVVTDIVPLGTKDHSLPQNALDTSDQSGQVFMANWPIKGFYMPDGIANYTVDGVQYLVTANEGDARDYDALAEESKVGDADYVLDPTIFPNADILKKNTNLGRLVVTNQSGDIDGDGDFDEIDSFGGRSFSIWNATTHAQVYDSGSDFERITAADPVYGPLFNASNDNGNFKNRSDNKGPEPEGVTIAEIAGHKYAFITLERIGGLMAYDITNPATPVFVSYKNNRTATGGDLGPEGIIYIKPENSPNATGLIVLANEVSATISVYKINNDQLSTTDLNGTNSFTVYPNPVKNGQVFFSKPVDVQLFDISGRLVAQKDNASNLEVSGFAKGIYVVKTAEGYSQKIIIQ
jgi:hypothetical protein